MSDLQEVPKAQLPVLRNEEPKAGARLSICEGFLRARFVLVNYHNIDKIWYDLEYIA